MKDKDETKIARVTEVFLKMKKFDIAELKKESIYGRQKMNPVLHFEMKYESRKRMVKFMNLFSAGKRICWAKKGGNYILATMIESDENDPK
jgi:hypothetical protein